MRGYKLTDEISIPELLKMRESGMSNSEIAESLDVSYKTICNYLGKGGPRRQTRRAPHVQEGTPVKEEPIAACLKMEPSEIRLTGAYGKYAFAPDGDSISVIIALTIVGIWTTALTIFVMLRLFDIIVPQVFLVTLPVSLLVYMVLMCVFNRRRYLALVIYLFVLSLLLLLYFFLPVARPWQIFIIAAPALIIVFLSFNVRSNPGRLARITNKIKRFLKK